MLNIDNLKLANSWADTTSLWSLEDICASVAGAAYFLTNPKSPRKFEICMNHFFDSVSIREQ